MFMIGRRTEGGPVTMKRLLRSSTRASFLLGALTLLVAGGRREAAADSIILFTASTDYTGNIPNADGSFGYSYPNDPVNQNPNLPGISSGVTFSQATGGLSDTMVGPLPDGTTYGPFGFNQNAAGTTVWVTTSYTFMAAGNFRIAWEVANVFGTQGGDALATDNITLNGNKIVQFQPGGGLPMGYFGQGNVGTSAGVTGLPTSGGDPGFAYLDVQPGSTTGVAPIFDTSGDVYSASRLLSPMITVKKGDILTLDVAFITDSGSPYNDYGAVALFSVPEPSSMVLAALGFLGAAGAVIARRRKISGR